jgi:folate-binding protein YgfZ
MPMSASDTTLPDREYQALTRCRAIVELVNWSSISVTGADRQSFLHNFSTNDVKRLVPGTSCEAFFTNVKGKIVGHGLIDCRESELVIVGVPGQAEALLQHLDRYIIREDVQLHDATGERRYLVVAGEVLAEIQGHLISWNLIGRGDTQFVETTRESAADVLAQLVSSGFLLTSPLAFEAARIEAGFPFFGVDFDSENLPQEVGRGSEAISFKKGCYLGQETVARIDALGHVNQKLVGIRFAKGSVPARGTELALSSKGVGAVTSVAVSPKLDSPLALAMVRRGANSVGTRLASTAGECEVVALPIA